MTEVLSSRPEDLRRAAGLLKAGQVVAVPTETVYGLAGLLARPEGLARIFDAKERPRFDPLIVHVLAPGAGPAGSRTDREARPVDALARAGLVDPEALSRAARGTADALMAAFWPGPLTLVLPRGPAVPDLVTAGLPTVALRAPAHPVAQQLLRALGGRPFAAPSANRFGRVSPTRVAHVLVELGGRIPAVVDGGPCPVGLESTIVEVLPDGDLCLRRPGGVPEESLVAQTGRPIHPPPAPSSLDGSGASGGAGPQVAPGALDSHYAPGVPVICVDRGVEGEPAALRARRLLDAAVSGAPRPAAGSPDPGSVPATVAFLLMEPVSDALLGDLRRGLDGPAAIATLPTPAEAAAAVLFDRLRRLDEASPGPRLLVAERPAPTAGGLLHAIRDRLGRASGRTRSRQPG